MPIGAQGFAELHARVKRAARAQGRNELGIVGVSAIRSDRVIVRRKGWSPTLSLGVVFQGRKRVRVAGFEHTYGPGDCLVVTGEEDIESSVLSASTTRPYLSLSVQLDPAVVAAQMMALADVPHPEVSANVGVVQPGAPAAFVTPFDAPLVDTALRLVRTADDAAERAVLAPLVLAELAFRLLRSQAASALRLVAGRGDDQRRIQTAMEFIRAHAEERLSVERIARHVAMSPSHFAHRFRAIARVSPIQYLKHVRLMRARLMMVHEGVRPAEAANAVGYASSSHFTRDFKRHFDAPPASYVQSIRRRSAVVSDEHAVTG